MWRAAIAMAASAGVAVRSTDQRGAAGSNASATTRAPTPTAQASRSTSTDARPEPCARRSRWRAASPLAGLDRSYISVGARRCARILAAVALRVLHLPTNVGNHPQGLARAERRFGVERTFAVLQGGRVSHQGD